MASQIFGKLGEEVEEEIKGVEINKVGYFEKPMVFDLFTFIMIITFGIAVFFNITFLNSTVDLERQKAIVNIGLVSLFMFGFGLKAFSDNLKLVDDNTGMVTEERLTSSQLELFNAKGILTTFLGVGINLGVSLGISIFLAQVPLSIFDITLEQITFAIISSVAEEMFFLGLQDVIGSMAGIVTIPINIGIFGLYHGFVYAEHLVALIYVLIIRGVYAGIYSWLKRPSCSMIAHLASNVIALIQLG